MKSMEYWKDVEGFEGLYQVSNYGRVKSLPHYVKNGNGYRKTKEKILKTFNAGDKKEYHYIKLKRKPFSIHRLVAEAFIPNEENKPQVDHIIPIRDGGGDEVGNLRWTTPSENNSNPITLMKKRNIEERSKKVCQYTLEGELVKVYPSLHEAERYGFSRKEIMKCCKGTQHTHKGFKWNVA